MLHVIETFEKKGYAVFCPNLLNHEPFDYTEEETAYNHFMDNVGFEKAANKIKTLINETTNDYERIHLLGFSVGATVAWLCSEEESVDAIVGYYGSRIKNYATINPKAPTLLLFPEREKSFNVDDIIATLNQRKIQTLKYTGEHGFSDPYSAKYHSKSAEDAYRQTLNFFQMKG